jgi:hypothetical protein
VPDDTTVAPEGDAATTTQEPDWVAKYKGAQRVIAARDEALATSQTELDRLRSEHEKAIADLATYRQRDVDASEEDLARQQYDQLRQRFEPEPPKPIGNSQARSWADGSGERYAERERTGTGSGWPI